MISDMTSGTPWKIIFYFSMPMLLGNLFQQLYNLVDSVIVGKFVSEQALAAVGASFPISFLFIAISMGLSMGCSVVISQYFGAGRTEDVRRSVTTAVLFLTGVSVIVSVVGFFLCEPILRLLKTPPLYFDMAKEYLEIFSLGVFFMFAYNTVASILRGLGDSKTPLLFLIVAALLNIVLDYIFVVYFYMGVAGVAWATMIAQAVSVLLSLIYVTKKIPLLRFKKEEIIFDKPTLKTMMSYGFPSMIQQCIVSFGMMAVQGLINSYSTLVETASLGAGITGAMKIDSLAMMPIMNIGSALATFTAQNVGAGEFVRVEKGYRMTLFMSFLWSALISLIVWVAGDYLMKMFLNADSPNAIAFGSEYLKVVSLFYIVSAVMFSSISLLRGAGDVRFAMLVTIMNLGTRVFFAYALTTLISYRSIWWSVAVGWVIAAILSFARYKLGRWKTKGIIFRENSTIINSDL